MGTVGYMAVETNVSSGLYDRYLGYNFHIMVYVHCIPDIRTQTISSCLPPILYSVSHVYLYLHHRILSKQNINESNQFTLQLITQVDSPPPIYVPLDLISIITHSVPLDLFVAVFSLGS